MMPPMPAEPASWSEQRSTKEHRKLVRNLVLKALRSGELTRRPCQICGAPNSVAHHENYAQPLAVTWLCPSHHVKRHLELDPTRATRLGEAANRKMAERMDAICYHGRWVSAECKAETGTLSSAQAFEATRLRKSGGRFVLVFRLQDLLDEFRNIDANI